MAEHGMKGKHMKPEHHKDMAKKTPSHKPPHKAASPTKKKR